MKKITFCIALLCACLSMQAQLLWKISGNSLEKPSYLFGTHHLAPIRIMEDITELRPALQSVDQVVGELVMSEMQNPEAMMKIQQMAVMSDGTTLNTLFTPGQYALVNSCTKEHMMLDLDMMPVLKPTAIQNNLIVLLYIKTIGDGYDPQFQLDGFIQKIGADNGNKVIGLETPEFQLDLLFNKTPLPRQATQLLCLVENIEKNMQNAKKLTDAYMEQDLDAMWALALEREGNQCDPLTEEWEALTDGRNLAWIEQLPAILEEGSSFIAVGALHLIGETGLINQLKKLGYQLEPMN